MLLYVFKNILDSNPENKLSYDEKNLIFIRFYIYAIVVNVDVNLLDVDFV